MKKESKHIVIVTPGFPETEQEKTCIPALQFFVEKLAKQQNIEVTVITAHYPFNKSTYLWHNCEVYALGFQNKKRNKLKSFFQQWKTLKLINKVKPIDVIHSFWLGECSFIGHYFSKKHNIKHLTTMMGQDAKKGNKYVPFLPLKKMKIVSLSSFHQAQIKNNYLIDTPIIPWGINYTPKPTVKTIDIIGIGSFIDLKKYTDFIETISLLKECKPSIKAVLIGSGPLLNTYKNKISALQLEDTIDIKGALCYNETQEYLSMSKVLLHTSEFESFGMVFAEAIANHTAIVSRAVGFANNSKHWHVGNNTEDFKKGCLYFLENKQILTPNPPRVDTSIALYFKNYYS